MPVFKFRSVEDMPDAGWHERGSPDLVRAVARVWRMGRHMRPRRFPPGVHKFRSIEEMSAQRERWTDEHVAAVTATSTPPRR